MMKLQTLVFLALFGIIPLFFFAGESSPVWLTPRVSMPVIRDKVNISAGALLGTLQVKRMPILESRTE